MSQLVGEERHGGPAQPPRGIAARLHRRICRDPAVEKLLREAPLAGIVGVDQGVEPVPRLDGAHAPKPRPQPIEARVPARRATVAGWTSLSVIVLVIGSVQLLILGVIGEYIGRIYNQSKNRPLYIVSDVAGRGQVTPRLGLVSPSSPSREDDA